ncbi:hypothetical protein SAMN04488570_1422 [Nocardioides scoriae]|uniref:DUF554 domain-containing protein n=1 Tax=Nocardioides scoriae TaxID=642780 RepID=A0A1H1QJM2_9ACTN|nr:DUF554 domain-containing protein [Nocardioides scoriae]SDS23109.1 hypothetical protein SAMN04488570_1422 [Nocardioides scoriae]
MFPGVGTLVNVVTVLLGTLVGTSVGHRLPERTRTVVTDGLGLVTLLIAAGSAAAVGDAALSDAVGDAAPLLVVLGSVLVGGITGSLLRIEDRLEALGGLLQRAATRRARRGPDQDDAAERARARFVQGFVVSSLVFCVGPLTILGSLQEGLGNGADQLLLKSALDGFAAIAFAASFGWGVGASVLSLVVVQGGLTVLGAGLGSFVPDAHLAALTATGGLLLVGVALRLLDLKQVKVADLLPALVVAPLLTQLVVVVR